jgi:TonB family protein
MRSVFLFLLPLFFIRVSFGQTTAQLIEEKNDSVYFFSDEMPKFPGGDTALVKFIRGNITYPEQERDSNIQGKVLLRLIINDDGSVSDVKVMKSASAGLDSEAVRVAKLLPNFIPGTQNGKPIKVYFNLPVNFKLKQPEQSAGFKDSNLTPLNDTSRLGAAGSVFTFVEENPQFPGGEAGLIRFLQTNIVYPQNALEQKIQGKVLLRFVVNEDGSVSDVKVVRSVCPDLDREAWRVVKLLPRFIPGKRNGQPVKVYFNLPIVFKLNVYGYSTPAVNSKMARDENFTSGIQEYRLGNLNQAIKFFEQSIASSPSEYLGYEFKAICEADLLRLKQACEDYKKAKALGSPDVDEYLSKKCK